MSYLININDFKGRYRIAVSTFNTLKWQEYIDQVEEQMLLEDFGKTFYSDVAINPSKEKYTDLLDSGYKDYLLGSTYFYYQRDAFLSSSTGNVKINNSNSVNVPDAMNGAIAKDRYNLGVNYYNRGALDFLNESAVQSYLINSATDIGSGLLELAVTEIMYLYANDVITINNVDYVVQSVDETLGKIVILSTDLTLVGSNVIFMPFTETYFDPKFLITP